MYYRCASGTHSCFPIHGDLIIQHCPVNIPSHIPRVGDLQQNMCLCEEKTS